MQKSPYYGSKLDMKTDNTHIRGISSGHGGVMRIGQSHSPIPVDKLWKLQ